MANLDMASVLKGATTTEESSGNQTSDSDDLPAVFSEIGADEDRVRDAVERDWVDLDVFTEIAEYLRDNPEAWELIEEYRLLNDFKRVELSHIRGQYTGNYVESFRDALYNRDRNINEVADEVRADDNPLNLPYYKTMFPEPVEEYCAEDRVQWSNFDEIGLAPDDAQDSQIWLAADVVQEWVEKGDRTADHGAPLPPAEVEDDSGTSGSAGEYVDVPDPSRFNTDQLRDLVKGIDDPDKLDKMAEMEASGKDRKTAYKHINRRISQVAEESQDDGDEYETIDDVPKEVLLEKIREGYTAEEVLAELNA